VEHLPKPKGIYLKYMGTIIFYRKKKIENERLNGVAHFADEQFRRPSS
jgi:hypothetical protein